MKKRYKFTQLLMAMLLCVITFGAYAQDKSVTGKVVDENGEPLPGVSILIKGSTKGTTTDLDGKYALAIATADPVLVFSYIGYLQKEVTVGSQTVIDIQMDLDQETLEEIVIIGYGEVKKEDATGAVLSVGSDDFNKGAIANPQELLIGKVPGVVINTNSGQPGTGSQIRIRGGSSLSATNDPLIVIDGLPLSNRGQAGMSNPLASINPNDIESFTVLKDASATAIYGSRASNGVIIITTKKGAEGALKVSYNGNVSVGTVVDKLDVYNGDDFRALVQDRVTNHGLSAVALDALGTENTDWQDEIYRNAVSTDHNVSVSGTLNDIPFRVSAGYTSQNGLLKESNFSRTNLNFAVTPSLLNDDLKVELTGKLSASSNDFSNTDAIGDALRFDPTQPITNGNTRYGGYTAWTELSGGDPINGLPNNIASHNPVARLKYRDNISDADRYIVGGKFDYKLPVEGLKATLNLGYDYFTSSGHDMTDTLASWSYREPNQQVKTYKETQKNALLDFYLSYKKELGNDHKIDLTAGYSYQSFEFDKEDVNFAHIDAENPANKITQIDRGELFLVSLFGRLNYTFKDRYLFTATLRNDHSSRFSKDNRSGVFPSLAFAWKINEEGFLADNESVSNLKLRLGWGVTGQQDLGDDNLYPFIPVYQRSTQGAYYQFGNTFYPTLRPNAYNPNLKWEETTTQNFGLDFGFFNNRLSGSIDYYKRETKDLLNNNVPIAAGSNFSNRAPGNVGTLENSGFEIVLTGGIIAKSDFTWEVSANFTYNKNEITKLSLIDDPDYLGDATGGISGGVGNNVQVRAPGYANNTFFLFNQVYDQNGMPIEGLYLDNSGDGGNVTGNEKNKEYLKNPAPEYLIGLSSTVTYKNFDFTFSGRLSLNNYVYNNNASASAWYNNIYNQSGYTANILTAVTETNFEVAQYFSDFYLEDASFFRMDNISFGYNFNKVISDNISGRVSFTIQNAFVITDYKGIDPEIPSGIDNNVFPRPRTYILGVNLNF
jgi:iron complex outermembrane receptor protein